MSASSSHADAAGRSDDAVRAATGRDWAEWVAELDRRRAWEMEHRDLARMIAADYGVSMWWTQSVTVGYERIKGLRAFGQRRGGGFEASRSKTIAAPAALLFQLAADARRRARWWPGVKVEAKPDNRTPTVRVRHDDGTVTNLHFTAKPDGRTTVTVVGSELPDRAAADAFKTDWGERLGRLAEIAVRAR